MPLHMQSASSFDCLIAAGPVLIIAALYCLVQFALWVAKRRGVRFDD